MNVLDHAKIRATRLRLELISVERFIEQYHEFAAEAATVSAQAEDPEAAASEHPEAHSMATGGKQDAGAVASGHESEATLIRAAVPMGTESATRKDAVAAASDPNADCSSAGGRAETDASPAAPNTETTGPLPSAGEADASPALTANQQAVLDAHKAHPEMTVTQIAKFTGMGTGSVSKIVKAFGLELPQHVSFASRLRTYAAENPTHTMEDCAAAIGEPIGKVRNNAHANKIKFAPGRRGRKPSTEQRKPDPAPTPAPKAKPAPVESYARTRPGSVIMPRAQSIPTGKQFWLKNDAGQYLNRFCLGFTSDRREAWTGNESQLAGCRRNFSIARDLREWPVEKDQPMLAARAYA